MTTQYIVKMLSCLGKHINLVRGVVYECGNRAEVFHVSYGQQDGVEEEAQSQKDEVSSP